MTSPFLIDELLGGNLYMRALAKRHSQINSKLDKTPDHCFTKFGFDSVITFRRHALKRKQHRTILHANVVWMVKKGFEEILDLKHEQEFILTNTELDMSVVGCVSCTGSDIVIRIITVIDSAEPRNEQQTLMIAV